MLKILMDMAIQNEQRPGCGPSQDLEKGAITSDTVNKPCNLYGLGVGLQAPNHRRLSPHEMACFMV